MVVKQVLKFLSFSKYDEHISRVYLTVHNDYSGICLANLTKQLASTPNW